MTIPHQETPQATLLGPEIQISCLSNVYVRRMYFSEVGIIEVGHRHPYDHASLVANGAVEVQVYDDETKKLLPPVVYAAPAMIMIRANMAHQLKSVVDNTVVCCIHALRDETGELIDPSMLAEPTSLLETQKKFYETTKKMLKPPADPFDDLTAARVPRMFNSSAKF